MNERLKKYLEAHSYVQSADAEALGVSRAMLSYMAKTGTLQRVMQGVYSLPDSFPDELQLISSRSQNIVFSHETALVLHGLHNRIPEKPTLTLPRGFSTPLGISAGVKVYRVKPANLDIGRSVAKTFIGHPVSCYDMERTVCDIIRSYSRIDIETYANALRTYAKSPARNIPRLMEYARALGIEGKVAKTMEVLL